MNAPIKSARRSAGIKPFTADHALRQFDFYSIKDSLHIMKKFDFTVSPP